MTDHILDLPVWTALTGPHAAHAVGDGGARRYQSDISVLAGLRDESDAALDDLGALVPDDGHIIVAQTWAARCPAGARIAVSRTAYQMVCHRQTELAAHDHDIIPLTTQDWPEMLALATATEPGPFVSRTPVLGDFWGVKRGGRLIAMAGQRLRQGDYVELSGICTDPDHQGLILGSALTVHVRDAILAQGRIPYLHAYTTNTPALRLYEKLGFETRATLYPMVLEKDH